MSEIQIDVIMEAIAPTPTSPKSNHVVPPERSVEGIWTKNDGGDYWISLKVVGASSGYSAFLSLISKGAEPGRVVPPCPLFIGFGTPIHVSSNSFSFCWNDPGFMGRVNHWGGTGSSTTFRKVENSNAITDGAHASPEAIFEKMRLRITGCSCLKHTTLANVQFWRLLERAVALDLARQRLGGAVKAGTRVIWMHRKDPTDLAFLRTKAAVYIKDNGGKGFGMDLENFFGPTRRFGMKVLLLRTNFIEWAECTTHVRFCRSCH